MKTLLMADSLRDQPDEYYNRVMPPAETVRRLQPFLADFGITRIARQTGLDRIGIPCFAAFRPNASTLSNSQGKGIDDDAARASALMEAVEFSIAEQPNIAVEAATLGELRGAGRPVFDAKRLMPIGQGIAEDLPLDFATGVNLLSGAEVMVPYEAVTIDPAYGTLPALNRSTNGLASGNTEGEAVFHALCELIERDATALHHARPGETARRLIDIASIESPTVNALINKIRGAGFDLWVVDQTSDLGVPSFQAIIGDPAYGYSQHFDIATGYGCHPVVERALIRAITEAAQTRVTNIAGSRDDFVPDEYSMSLHRSLLDGLDATSFASLPAIGCGAAPLATLHAFILERLRAKGVNDVTMVRLGGAAYGISVVKVFAPDLEDRAANRNWRPGKRYLRAMMAAR